jgi:hypothetical protein
VLPGTDPKRRERIDGNQRAEKDTRGERSKKRVERREEREQESTERRKGEEREVRRE